MAAHCPQWRPTGADRHRCAGKAVPPQGAAGNLLSSFLRRPPFGEGGPLRGRGLSRLDLDPVFPVLCVAGLPSHAFEAVAVGLGHWSLGPTRDSLVSAFFVRAGGHGHQSQPALTGPDPAIHAHGPRRVRADRGHVPRSVFMGSRVKPAYTREGNGAGGRGEGRGGGRHPYPLWPGVTRPSMNAGRAALARSPAMNAGPCSWVRGSRPRTREWKIWRRGVGARFRLPACGGEARRPRRSRCRPGVAVRSS